MVYILGRDDYWWNIAFIELGAIVTWCCTSRACRESGLILLISAYNAEHEHIFVGDLHFLVAQR